MIIVETHLLNDDTNIQLICEQSKRLYNLGLYYLRKSYFGEIQKFTELPHARFIDKLTYKAKLVGIDVVCNEESYTSKIDSLSLESLYKQETYLGKRVKRDHRC